MHRSSFKVPPFGTNSRAAGLPVVFFLEETHFFGELPGAFVENRLSVMLAVFFFGGMCFCFK